MARRRSGKKIEYSHWTGAGFSFPAQAAGTAAATVVAAQHLTETLLRTRGSLLGFVDANATPPLACRVDIGLAQVPEGTGTTVLWSPAADSDAPWIWFDSFVLGYEEYVTDVIDCPVASGYRTVIDSKAMRIIRNRELQIVIENTTLTAATSVNVFGFMRFLAGHG